MRSMGRRLSILLLATAMCATAQARVAEVRALLEARKHEAAQKLAEQWAKDAPNDSAAHLWLGNAYGAGVDSASMLGKMRFASKLRDAFTRAVELDPNNLDARMALVQFHTHAPGVVGGDRDLAREHGAAIAERDVYRGHIARAALLRADKKPAEAAREYESAYRLKPRDPEARLMLGIAYQTLERWSDAAAHFRAWAAEDPTAARAWYQIGRTAALSGQKLDEGAAAFQRYLVLPRAKGDPENKHAYYRLGQLYARAGKKAEAVEALEAALALDPQYADAKRELAKARR